LPVARAQPQVDTILVMNSPDIRICFIGDSYVQGTGDDDCLGWVGRLCASARCAGHNITAYNLGVRRETSTDIARRWETECAPRLLSDTENYVVFSFGANDVSLANGTRRVHESDTITNLHTILNNARTHYRTLVIGSPPTADAEHNVRLARLSERMQHTATQLDVPYIATFPLLAKDTAWIDEVRGHDGAHPRAHGYAHLARIIAASSAWWFGNQ
jgi:acyl-CoA thioesterase-1